MYDLMEILSHWQAGDGVRRISRNLGVARNTVAKHVESAERSGLRRDQPLAPEDLKAFVREHFPQVNEQGRLTLEFMKLEPFCDEIGEGLKENCASTVWQRLRDERRVMVSRPTFYRYVNQQFGKRVKAADVVVHRPEGIPGDEVQVDFGRMGRWDDPVTGNKYTVQAFIMTLAWSRHVFVRPVLKLDGPTWLTCHIEAFSFFGAIPHRIVLDNLKDGVVKPDLYDPQFNKAYRDLSMHYGILLDPCRVASPTQKPHVERAVPYVRDSFYRGRKFGSWEEIVQNAVHWCLNVAGTRIHGTTKLRPLEVYEAEEKSFMLALPAEPWELWESMSAKVHPDAHCSIKRTLYSVPWKLIGRTLDVRVTPSTVQFLDGENVVKTHLRLDNSRRQTDPADLPPERIAFFQRNPQWCREKADSLGPAVAKAVTELLQENTLIRLRQVQGIIRLDDKYGAARLNAACLRALDFGDPGYRTVRNILKEGLDCQPSFGDCLSSKPAGAFLRGPEAFSADVYGTEGRTAR